MTDDMGTVYDKMRCPKCGCGEVAYSDEEWYPSINVERLRRVCGICGARYVVKVTYVPQDVDIEDEEWNDKEE